MDPGCYFRRMLDKRSDRDSHVREEWQVPEKVVQFGVVGNVEDAEVGVLTHDPPDVLPLARPLQILAVSLLPGECVSTLARVHVEGQLDVHGDREQHRSSQVEDEVVDDVHTGTVGSRLRVEHELGFDRGRDVVVVVRVAGEVQLCGN